MSVSVYCMTVSGDMLGRSDRCSAHQVFSGSNLFLSACASCEFSFFSRSGFGGVSECVGSSGERMMRLTGW
jgi:hypothetical protein